MNADAIVTIYVVIDDLLKVMRYQDDVRARLSAAEILMVAIVAAQQFQNHHERALGVLYQTGYIAKFSVSRFNRRLHALKSLFSQVLTSLGELLAGGEVFIIDAMPIPVCKLVRDKRCTKLQGREYYGYCVTKKQHFFGWHLHLVCDAQGIPVAFDWLPARWDELVAVQYLLADLPPGSQVVADKGYISVTDQQLAYVCGEIRLIPRSRRNMCPNSPEDVLLIRQHRPVIETLFSQLEKMGIQRLHARTINGLDLKLLASLAAVTFSNAVK